VQVEHRRQVVAVASARLGAGTLKPLPVLGGPGNVGEVSDIELRGFLIHAIEDDTNALWCRTNFRLSGASPYVKEFVRIPTVTALISVRGKVDRYRRDNQVDSGPGGVRFWTAALFPEMTNEAMNLTEDELTELSADSASGGDAHRRPITDVDAWLAGLHSGVRPALRALGELLVGVAEGHDAVAPENAERFTARCLGVAGCGLLVEEERDLNPVSRFTFALALAEWIEKHTQVCEIGPADSTNPPTWTQTEIGGQCYRHPRCVRVHFPAGTLLADTGCVIALEGRQSLLRSAEVSACVTPDHQDRARALLDRLAERANQLNPYRGHAVRATHTAGLTLTVIDLPCTATRDNVIVADQVWAEVDLGVSAVRDRHDLLNTHGLGARRGVLLCGPPGTGKSAVSAVVARELVGEFTVIYVEAKAGTQLLTAVVEEAQRLGGPVLLVLEDIDLWCRDRTTGDGGLSELLGAMDIGPDARILTLASTNDAATLDKAAIRTGRFDSIVEVGYPTHTDAARILAVLLADLSGGPAVDSAAVAAALPENTSGSDIREIVRRAVLTAADGHVNTATLLAEIGSRRYRPTIPEGMYL
jgi:cell division protease FtsH